MPPKGYKFSLETRARMGEGQRNRYHDPKERVKTSEAARHAWQTPKYRAKVSESMRLRWLDPKYRMHHSKAMVRVSEITRQQWQNPAHRAEVIPKLSKATKRQWHNPEYRAILTAARKRQGQDLLNRAKISNTVKRLWLDPEYVVRVIAGANLKPNKLELWFQDFLDVLFPGEWKYVGDFQLVIGGKCPDFMNVNGKKKLIEIFGDYWHSIVREDNPQDRIDHFARYGFGCLVIWESELKDTNAVIEKIEAFMEAKSEAKQGTD